MKITLGKQLGLAFGLLLTFLLMVVLFGYWESNRIIEEYETEVIRDLKISGIAKDLSTEVLQIRRREKDFLARNELKYAEQTQVHVAQAIALAKKIEQDSPDNEIQQWASQAQQEATRYSKNFKTLQAATVARGLDENSGAQGTLREFAHQLETLSEEHDLEGVEINYLQIRRYEKDYHRTGTSRYLNLHEDAIANFLRNMEEISISEELKSQLKQELKEYRETWESYRAVSRGSETGLKRYEQVRVKARILENQIDINFIPDGMKLYLTLRKHEKDYLLRLNPIYLQRADQTIRRYKQHIESSVIDSNTKAKLSQMQDDYWQALNQWSSKTLEVQETRVTVKKHADSILELVDLITVRMAQRTQEKSQAIKETTESAQFWRALLSVVAFVFSIGIALFFTRKIMAQIGGEPVEIMKVAQDISGGNFEVGSQEKGIGIYGSLQEIAVQTEERLEELLETEANTRTIVENELAQKQKEVEEQNWLKSGQNGLNEIMRGEQDMRVLSQNIINYIADYLDAQVGAFYLAYSETLKLTSSYAYKIRNNNYTEFKLGEGLPGQAALEKKSILFADLPESHLNVDINSGLGTSQPANILAVPLLTGGELMGVLELGTSRRFEKREMAFLDQITENIAIAINSSQNRFRNQELLEETQRQAEELESQQEELRQINEDLSQKSESLEQQKADIEKKNSEIEKKAEELAFASKYKSEFLANMSHELRSPLNSLLLLAHSLSENKEENLNEKQIESLRIISNGGNELLSLINEILDLSRIEAGRVDVDFNEVNLQDLADSVKNNFQHLASNKGLELKIEVDPRASTLFLTDRKRLEQVMKNLISNALKFTEKGQISVKFKPCPKDISLRSGLEPTNLLMIAISDTGIGIAQEKQKLIFEAFQQAEGGTSRKYGGTGLGLSISRELIHLLGGEIQLESEVSSDGRPGGSTFMLFLPIEPGVQTRAPKTRIRDTISLPKARPTPQLQEQIQFTDDRDLLEDGDQAILVIDDDINFANIIRDQCLEKGLKCLIAPTGEDGLQLVNQFMPVGIVLDLHLPGIDGWDVLEKLKDDTQTRHIPVHMISVEESTLEATKKGAIGFLTKPVTSEELGEMLEKIEEVIQKKIKKLLVIEDEEPQRKHIVELVGNHDLIATEAANGEEGIKAIQSEDFDCIILDLVLPDITGFQLLRKLDQDEKISLPPVVIYTGKDLTREEEMDLRQYTDSIIIKTPRSEERLLDQTALFLHRVVSELPAKKQETIRKLHDKELIFKNKKILLVDDDMRNLFALSKILEENGMKTLKAEQGQKGLDLLKKEPDVNLILMDIMMPDMDGYETIRRIRKQRKFAKLPIIALTAKAMPGDREKCIEAGANDYLSKPVNIDRLFSMMRIWLYQ